MTGSVSHEQPEQLLTVADIAGIVGAHEQTVRHWVRTRELKASKFGTRIGDRIKRSDGEDLSRAGAVCAKTSVSLWRVSRCATVLPRDSA